MVGVALAPVLTRCSPYWLLAGVRTGHRPVYGLSLTHTLLVLRRRGPHSLANAGTGDDVMSQLPALWNCTYNPPLLLTNHGPPSMDCSAGRDLGPNLKMSCYCVSVDAHGRHR